jgi:hypothetical protein
MSGQPFGGSTEPKGKAMFQTIPEIAGQGPGRPRGGYRRTWEPVRRHSRLAGREGVFWRPVSRREIDRIILAAERFELSGKLTGRKNGPLGGVALEVLRLFRNLADFRTGRLDPSLDFLMAKLRRSRAAIVAALKALRHHGFLDWLRRYVPTGNEGRGPQVRQTSNAYRLSLPKRAAAMLGRYFSPAPVPDDHSHRQELQAAEIEAHRQSLSLEELPLFEMGADDPLAQSLARLGAAIQARKEREFIKETESPI